MEKQGFEEKEELKSRLESTMEEKFKLEKVSKYIFRHHVLLFSSLSLPRHTDVFIFPNDYILFMAVTPLYRVPYFIYLVTLVCKLLSIISPHLLRFQLYFQT